MRRREFVRSLLVALVISLFSILLALPTNTSFGTDNAGRGLVIGSRGSPLALAQATEVKDMLLKAKPEYSVSLSIIKTTGDKRLDIPLGVIGGKRLFTKELDIALANNKVDLCVHSMKDVPTTLPPGMVIGCVLPRSDPRDVLVVVSGGRFDGSRTTVKKVGTASLRRSALYRRLNHKAEIVMMRGNVQTRLRHLAEGKVDGLFIAMAALLRLDMVTEEELAKEGTWTFSLDQNVFTALPLSQEDMLAAVAQGAIAVQIRQADAEVFRLLLEPLNCKKTTDEVLCERAFLKELDGNCHTPIAGHAEVSIGNSQLRFRGLVADPMGQELHSVERSGKRHDATEIGIKAAIALRKKMGVDFLEKVRKDVDELVFRKFNL